MQTISLFQSARCAAALKDGYKRTIKTLIGHRLIVAASTQLLPIGCATSLQIGMLFELLEPKIPLDQKASQMRRSAQKPLKSRAADLSISSHDGAVASTRAARPSRSRWAKVASTTGSNPQQVSQESPQLASGSNQAGIRSSRLNTARQYCGQAGLVRS